MPKSLVFVLIVFGWGAGQALDQIVRFSIKAEYYVWDSLGLPWVFFVVAFLNLLLSTSAATVIYKRMSVGFTVCFAAVAWGLLSGFVTTSLAVRDIPGVREAYAIGREARGLAVREDAMTAIFSPSGLWAAYGFSAAFLFLLAFLVWRQRSWFTAPEL